MLAEELGFDGFAATGGTGSPSTTSTLGWRGRRRPWSSQAVAAATSTIRVGSGAMQTGHRTPLSVVEEFGILDALYPGRIDLGLGRSGGPRSIADPGNGQAEERVVDGELISEAVLA